MVTESKAKGPVMGSVKDWARRQWHLVLLGLLMMVTRRNAVSQVVGFMSLENGLVLAATGANQGPYLRSQVSHSQLGRQKNAGADRSFAP